LLIQVQKGKVDLEGALLILEKIIRSNELSLGLMAILPLIFVLYNLGSFGKQRIHNFWNRDLIENEKRLEKLIWKTDCLITKKSEDPLELGKLLVCLDEMYFLIQESNLDGDLNSDIVALADPWISFEQRHWILNRIYHQTFKK
jgi:hypothetical protein